MQNLLTVRQHVTSLPPDPTHAVFYDQLFTLHQLQNCLLLHSPTEQHHIYTSSNPVGLAVHNGDPLLATRAGELISVQEGNVTTVGDVTHESPEKSGILAIGASPDGSLLVLVSPVSIIVLDSEFEKLLEVPLDQTAAQANVSWRSDGQFFVVVFSSDQTRGLVIDRSCEIIKPLDGAHLQLCCSAAWESRVGGMVCVPNLEGNLLFFESNGLRHIRSDFNAGHSKFARWNQTASILAVVDPEGVTFWTRVNYYWYKKKTVSTDNHVIDVLWDEDDVFCAHIVTSDTLIDLHMSMRTSTVLRVDGEAYVTVIDGCNIMLTNISRGIVPPPMSHGIVKFDVAVDSVFEAHGKLGVLRCDGGIETLKFSEPLQIPCVPSAPRIASVTRSKWSSPKEQGWNGILAYRFPHMISSNVIALVESSSLASSEPSDRVVIFRLDEDDVSLVTTRHIKGCVTAMSKSLQAALILTTTEDSVIMLDVDLGRKACTDVVCRSGPLKNEATKVIDVEVSPQTHPVIAHDKEGELEIIDFDSNKILSISNECTSFILHQDFLLFTTRSHLLYCMWMRASALASSTEKDGKVPSLVDEMNAIPNSQGNSWTRGSLAAGLGATRPIDRGSLIVAGIPKDVNVVLQVPRGNIETIAPRPLVFQTVYQYAKRGLFADAFNLCRRQRVDMNHLVDADYENFLSSAAYFVQQIGKAGHLSVFLSFLKGDPHKVNSICDTIVSAMRSNNHSGRYTTAILTGLIKREPSDLTNALDMIREARTRGNEEGATAVDYLFVLLKDEEIVYNHALGMYDLKLASFVAEASQMDPADFSNELRTLYEMDENYRKYNIDIKLEKYGSALQNLFACGEKMYKQCVSLCHKHQLYETALQLFRFEDDFTPELLNGYGSHLQRIGKFDDAAAVFIRNGDLKDASICYQKGGRWQLAVNAISRLPISSDQKCVMYDTIATGLTEDGDTIDAARIKATLTQDIDGAIELLTVSEEWDAAFELLPLWSPRSDSEDELEDLWNRIMESVCDGYETLLSTIAENCSKLRERRNRLKNLRESKQAIREKLDSKPVGDEASSDVFSATTASSIATNLSDITFTSRTSMTSLYTSLNQTGPLSAAKLEKQAEKRRRKAAKKRIRQGHPREEEALVVYLRKLIPNEFLQKRLNKTCYKSQRCYQKTFCFRKTRNL
eukprot:gb/GEZJ01003198.1/.p1 GENE.gb/GEZJ01003198.1/~~gb/GEZJ01003198.1/.p1  ORF type:complete len:1177 (-),score=191.67 gb/GEZJ01003198.1/:1681-5211(-)